MRLSFLLLVFASVARAKDGGMPPSELDSDRSWISEQRELLHEPLLPEGCASARVFRAIYVPSFARASVVTFALSPTRARLWLRTPTHPPADGGVELEQVEVELTPEVSGALLERLTTARPFELEDQPAVGVDGIGLMGSVCSPGEPVHHFVGWDYKPSRRLDFFRALIDVARASLPQLGSFAAERTLEYLAPPGELIFADTPGSPRTIRLVGISASHAEPFRALCASVKPDEDVVIDLRNFSGAGTMFKPEFMQLDRRKGRTVWVANPELAKHLVQHFGVARGHFADSLELAKKRLTR